MIFDDNKPIDRVKSRLLPDNTDPDYYNNTTKLQRQLPMPIRIVEITLSSWSSSFHLAFNMEISTHPKSYPLEE